MLYTATVLAAAGTAIGVTIETPMLVTGILSASVPSVGMFVACP